MKRLLLLLTVTILAGCQSAATKMDTRISKINIGDDASSIKPSNYVQYSPNWSDNNKSYVNYYCSSQFGKGSFNYIWVHNDKIRRVKNMSEPFVGKCASEIRDVDFDMTEKTGHIVLKPKKVTPKPTVVYQPPVAPSSKSSSPDSTVEIMKNYNDNLRERLRSIRESDSKRFNCTSSVFGSSIYSRCK